MDKLTATQKETAKFFLILTAFFGLYVRVFPVFGANFPLVDGGMFYSMIEDLQAAHFLLPAFTTYNQSQIPFAYPPLPFYLAGSINSLTGISLLDIIQWQPLLVSILTIPVFYYLARLITGSETRASLGTLIFALTPNSYWWNIVGGGLTRSLGALFFTLAAISAWKMYREEKPIWVAASILSGALAVLSHPEWALQSAVLFALCWLVWSKNRQGVKNSILVVVGILLLTAPWWVTVIQQHGIATLLRAGQVTHSRWLSWTILFALSFTGEYTPVIAVFSLIGLFIQIAKRDYFLPLWATLCLIADPRGGVAASIFPFTLLAVVAITDGIAPRLFPPSEQGNDNDWTRALYSNAGRLFFGFFVILFLYNAYNVSETLSHQVLSAEKLEAIEWVKSHTESTARFLILDEQGNPLLSPFTEWFPALAGRRSVATIQGTEWLEGNRHYNEQYPVVTSLHSCIYENAECLRALADSVEPYDFLVLSAEHPTLLLNSLEGSEDFVPTYSSQQIRIFAINGKINR